MDIFFRLLLAHLLGDYTFQTDYIAKWKSKSFLGVVVHSSIFLFFAVILLWDKLGLIWFKFPGWVCLLILYFLHIFEDEYRAYNVRHSHKEDNLIFFLWDQFIHIIFIYLFSPVENFVIEPIIIVLCLLVLGTHFSSVLILYIENVFHNVKIAYDNFKLKYFYIVLRLVTLLLFLLPGKLYFMSFFMIPLFFYGYIKIGRISKIGLFTNLLITYILGFLILVTLDKA